MIRVTNTNITFTSELIYQSLNGALPALPTLNAKLSLYHDRDLFLNEEYCTLILSSHKY